MASASKKGFDFRMSKKVAELTQVVHMLFTRNHEKEVEMEALRDAYEYELELVTRDARTRMDRLEIQLKELSKELGRAREGEAREGLEQERARLQAQYEARLQELQTQLADQRDECQQVRDLLIRAQQDLEQLRSAHTQELASQAAQLKVKDGEISDLKGRLSQAEAQLRNRGDQTNDVITDLQKANTRLKKENSQLQNSVVDLNKTKEQQGHKIKSLEFEVKQLKRELAKRFSVDKTSPNGRQQIAQAALMDQQEELEKLRALIHRYRMELYNREGNFNRVFSEKQPVVVDRRSNKALQGLSADGHLGPGHRTSQSLPGDYPAPNLVERRFMRERTLPAYMFDSDRDPSVHSSSITPPDSGRNRVLPQLGMDPRGRLQRLVRPKPLPKELLSAKSPEV